MHLNYGVISGSHACRDCVWNINLDSELYTIGSKSAPYGAPGLRERNLGALRAIRLLVKILTWLILQLYKAAIKALIKFDNGSVEMWQHGGNFFGIIY